MARYALTEHREPELRPGQPFPGTSETVLGLFDDEADAIAAGRSAWQEFRGGTSRDVAWWIVRAQGEDLARWIADGGSDVERILDLTTNTLVEVR